MLFHYGIIEFTLSLHPRPAAVHQDGVISPQCEFMLVYFKRLTCGFPSFFPALHYLCREGSKFSRTAAFALKHISGVPERRSDFMAGELVCGCGSSIFSILAYDVTQIRSLTLPCFCRYLACAPNGIGLFGIRLTALLSTSSGSPKLDRNQKDSVT